MPQNAAQDNELSPAQLRVLALLMAGRSVTEAADEVNVDRGTVHRWMRDDAAFVAEYNRVKAETRGRLYFRFRALHETAIETVASLLSDANVPPAVRLRAALAVLDLTSDDSAYRELIGPVTASGVREEWQARRAESEATAEYLRKLGIDL